MPATRADFTLFPGDDWPGVIDVKNPDGSRGDITGWTAQAYLRQGIITSGMPIEGAISAEIVPPDVVQVLVNHDITNALRGMYCWDLKLIDPNGLITTIMFGTVNVRGTVAA